MRFQRRASRKARVDMTPMIDVVVTLLLFFMMTSVFKVVPGLSLALPTSTTTSTVSLTQMRIVVASEGTVFVNSSRTDIAGMDQAVKREMKGKKPDEIRAVLQGDKAASYQLIISVLDILKANGIQGVSLLTQTPRGGAKP
jgi:biopolymer transport protein ExbD